MVRLNVGSGRPAGDWVSGEWVNVDVNRDFARFGVIPMDGASGLAFMDNSFDEVRAVHVLEHIRRQKHKPFLDELYRVLKPKGTVLIEVPNFASICRLLTVAHMSGDEKAIHKWTVSVYGKTKQPGDSHHWGFTEEDLKQKMERSLFKDVGPGRVSGHAAAEPVIALMGTK